MTLSLSQSYTAIAANLNVSFMAIGGTSPYVFSINNPVGMGAGGSIDSSTGLYTAPLAASSSPNHAYDIILVTDNVGATATAQILVGTALVLFCDIIQTGMGLSNGRCFLWDQKIFEPTDYDPFIVVSNPRCKPFSNIRQLNTSGSGIVQNQFTNFRATLEVNIISRGPSARDRKEEIILALYSIYSEQQQEANSFSVGRLPPNEEFINLSHIDSTAIPYWYQITVNLIYAFAKNSPVPYFDTFQSPTIYTNP